MSLPNGVRLVQPAELVNLVGRRLIAADVASGDAHLCARLMVAANRDGNFTHGVEMLPMLLQRIAGGHVRPSAVAERVAGHGAFEQWDGHHGLGPVNAHRCMARAIELAKTAGVGCVALRRNNHWFRGGNYGWQAASAGVVGLCWTNTVPLMPAVGGDRKTLGNNPLVIALPTADGGIVLDMAMSQFSIGAMRRYARRGERLPAPGGTDAHGQLTTDPGAILDGGLPLPAGLWKGAGLAMMLDLVAAMLSAGRATADLASDPVEHGVSQVFLCIAPCSDDAPQRGTQLMADVARFAGDAAARYPSSGVHAARRRADTEGIPVAGDVWQVLTGS